MSKVGTPEWHEERKKGVGGSDAAAALGVSKWKTPYQLYLEKTGEAEPVAETWEMSRGTIMEPLIRQNYADTTGRTVRLPEASIVCEKHPFMRFNPDGLTEDRRGLEIKTANSGIGWGEPGSDEIPTEYAVQVQHGMICLAYEVFDVTVSIGGTRPVIYEVPADRELQEMIIEGEARFWEMVQNRTPPEPVTGKDVARRYARSVGTSIEVNLAIMETLENLQKVRENLKLSENEKEQLEVAIKNFMGENEVLIDALGTVIATWKPSKPAERIDSKRLKTEQPVIAAQYTNIGEPVRRFLLK